jgi:hypothetical protein
MFMKKLLFITAVCIIYAASIYAQTEKTAARHMFTSSIVDREPSDSILSYTPVQAGKLYYFSELSNFQGETVKHVWSKNGEIVFELSFVVGAARWRVSSSMKAEHFKAGDSIKVEIIGADGTLYAADTLPVR